MSLRSILASEGLIRTALTVSPRTKARLNGGSLALKMAVAEIMQQLPGKDILKVLVSVNGPFEKRFDLKPGWCKLVSHNEAAQFIDFLESVGFIREGHLPQRVSLHKGGSPTPGRDSVRHWVVLRGTKNGDVFIHNGDARAGFAIMDAIEEEHQGSIWHTGFSANLAK